MATPAGTGRTALLQAVSMRGDTDAKLSYLLFVVTPLVLIVVGYAVAFAFFFASLLSGAPDIGAIVALYLALLPFVIPALIITLLGMAKLIARRNRHFARDRLLREGTLELCREAAPRATGDPYAAQRVDTLQRLHNEGLIEENERSVPLNVVLSVLTFGIWNLYILYFLLTDWARHQKRQAVFTEQTAALLHYAGVPGVPPVAPTPERNVVVSILLVMFVPLAGWLVVNHWLFKDPQDHFDRQWAHEDPLVRVAQQGLPPAVPPAAPVPAAPAMTSSWGATASPTTPVPAPLAPAAAQAAAPEVGPPWQCPGCQKMYRPSARRPLKVTCRACGTSAVLN